MPRRRRADKRRHELTIEVVNASLSIEGWEDHFGGPDEGRAAWASLRGQLAANLGMRPAPFWAYDPDVPAELRAMASIDPPAEIEARALRWLLSEGQDYLRTGETVVIQQRLEALRAA